LVIQPRKACSLTYASPLILVATTIR
jgi:hypothetical protein